MDVLIRDLPDEVHATLVRRAAERHISLRAYLQEILTEQAKRPSMAEWLDRVRALGPVGEGAPTGAALVEAGRDEDDGFVGR